MATRGMEIYELLDKWFHVSRIDPEAYVPHPHYAFDEALTAVCKGYKDVKDLVTDLTLVCQKYHMPDVPADVIVTLHLLNKEAYGHLK